MASQTATVEDIVFRWEEQGDGTPVVLIHGIPTCPALWRHVVPRLTGVRCLAWEMVGYGASIPQGRDRDMSVGRQTDYLVTWLRHLGLDQVVLAGHDLGGGVAQIAAVRNPGLCRGLFLTNAIGYDSWPIPSVKAMSAAGPLMRHTPNAMFKQVMQTFSRSWSMASASPGTCRRRCSVSNRASISRPRIIPRPSPRRSTGWSRTLRAGHERAHAGRKVPSTMP